MDLSRYRPTADTSVSINAAHRLAIGDFATMADRIAAAKDERDNLLIDGEPKILKAAEDRLRTTRDEQERLEAITLQLQMRYSAALRREALARVDAAKTQLSDANQAINEFWAADGEKLEVLMARSAQLYAGLTGAEHQLRNTRLQALADYPDDGDSIAAGLTGAALSDDLEGWRDMMSRGADYLIGQQA